MLGRSTGLTVLTGLLGLASSAVAANGDYCRCMPGDECWPSRETWSSFNQTIDGRLVATVPLGTPCHGDAYDQAKCDVLKEEWTQPELQ